MSISFQHVYRARSSSGWPARPMLQGSLCVGGDRRAAAGERSVRLPDRRRLHAAGVGRDGRPRPTAPSPVSGKYNICYVNDVPDPAGGGGRGGRRNHPDLLLKKAHGSYVGDPDWPGEILLDTSTAAKRSGIAAIEDGWIDGCAAKGFKAIEPDNLDSYTRSGGRLTKAENVALAALLASRAHGDGAGVRAEERHRHHRVGQGEGRVRLRDRRGVRLLRRVRLVHESVRQARHRDRVHRQREVGLHQGMYGPRRHAADHLPRPRRRPEGRQRLPLRVLLTTP